MQDQEESTLKNHWEQIMSVKTQRGFLRTSTWQVTHVGRPLESASHFVQVGKDLFIGKNETYIMNRKKKTSMLRKEGIVYVLNLLVKVLSGAAPPIEHKPFQVDAINQVANGREDRKRVTF